MKVCITTTPFDKKNTLLLQKAGLEVHKNPFGKKIEYDQLYDFLQDADYVIAGTEKYDKALLEKLHNLKGISRVGVGTDNIEKRICADRGIKIFNTPNAPSSGVAEYCLGMTIFFLRDVFHSNIRLKNNEWKREIGLSLSDAKIFLWGGGRIAKSFKDLLISCGAKRIYVHDIIDLNSDPDWDDERVIICNFEEIYDADIISLHLPSNESTKKIFNANITDNFITAPYLINTSRGSVVDDNDLIKSLTQKKIKGAAIDVFSEEPYQGPLLSANNIFTTPHIASSSKSVRYNMELESSQNLIKFINEK